MAWGRQKGGSSGIAWLALLVALLALYLAWTAYRRTGGSLDALVKNGPEERTEEVSSGGDWRDTLARARERLLARRSDVRDERNLEQVRRDVAQIRESLEKAYRDAGSGAREKWRAMDGELERLEAQLREGSSKARETLDSLLDRMRQ